MSRVFLLSPAHCGGQRARILMSPRAEFDLARRLRGPGGAPLGEVFSFMSGLYFRGKLAYARAFAGEASDDVRVITPAEGLLPPDVMVDLSRLQHYATVDIHAGDARYRDPLLRDIRALLARRPAGTRFVLLGSVATGKYVDPLHEVLGDRLVFPPAFVGRGDMSRGGLLLRCAAAGEELAYAPVVGSARHGPRPPRLVPRRGTGP
ncbi:MAG: hypothetical protein ABW020_14930 [Candidatus Rokuibacteriota bacterium]